MQNLFNNLRAVNGKKEKTQAKQRRPQHIRSIELALSTGTTGLGSITICSDAADAVGQKGQPKRKKVHLERQHYDPRLDL